MKFAIDSLNDLDNISGTKIETEILKGHLLEIYIIPRNTKNHWGVPDDQDPSEVNRIRIMFSHLIISYA